MLEDEGNLTSTTVDNKRVYAIVDASREVLKVREVAQQAEEAGHDHHWHGHMAYTGTAVRATNGMDAAGLVGEALAWWNRQVWC